jgi:hypothetical protein
MRLMGSLFHVAFGRYESESPVSKQSCRSAYISSYFGAAAIVSDEARARQLSDALDWPVTKCAIGSQGTNHAYCASIEFTTTLTSSFREQANSSKFEYAPVIDALQGKSI